MLRPIFFTSIFTILISISGYCSRFDGRTIVFDKNFHSLQVQLASNEFAPPVLMLDGSNDKLVVTFDEMTNETHDLRYKLIHCNADWTPSALIESEYVDGFNYADIEERDFSSATFADYVHYRFELPNDNMHFLVSGNYLVQVYPQDDEDKILLQGRFYVCDDMLNVFNDISSRTDEDYNDRHQQVTIRLAQRTTETISSWWNDIKVNVRQNMRDDNMATVYHPTLFESSTAVFDHVRELIFPAGNEFRRFECVQTNYPGMHIEKIRHREPFYHAELMIDQPRANVQYLYDQTQHGHYKIRQSDANDSDVNADYIVVHFTLAAPQRQDGKIYLAGDLTYNDFCKDNEMRYNTATSQYELSKLLKMGSYNYQYLFVPNGSKVGYTSVIEGDHYETVNEYFTTVYYHPAGERYDHLVGFAIGYAGR